MENQNPYNNTNGAPERPQQYGQQASGGGYTPPQPQPAYTSPVSQASAPVQPNAYAPTAQYLPAPAAPYAPAAAAAPAKKKNYTALIVILALAAIIVFGVASCMHSMASLGGLAGDSDSNFKPNTIAVITLDGTIQYDGSECSPEGLKDLLDEAEESENVKAVVLRVDSGGGTATAGEEMATYVRDFSKPVVVSSASLNASAAYEISSQADYIFVAKTTEIGAIGTVMQVTDFSGLLEKLGVDIDNIASAESKDSSYGTRPLTEEERQYYQDMIDEINSVFIDNVAQGRGMTYEEAEELATGLTWTGLSAVDNGVADEIGTLEDACDKAAELGGCAEDYETQDLFIGYSDMSALLDMLSYTSSNHDITAEDLVSAIKELEENDASIR